MNTKINEKTPVFDLVYHKAGGVERHEVGRCLFSYFLDESDAKLALWDLVSAQFEDEIESRCTDLANAKYDFDDESDAWFKAYDEAYNEIRSEVSKVGSFNEDVHYFRVRERPMSDYIYDLNDSNADDVREFNLVCKGFNQR